MKMALIFTDFQTGSASWSCALLEICYCQGLSLSKLEKFKLISALPNIKFNYVVLFWDKCIGYLNIYASKYIFWEANIVKPS